MSENYGCLHQNVSMGKYLTFERKKRQNPKNAIHHIFETPKKWPKNVKNGPKMRNST